MSAKLPPLPLLPQHAGAYGYDEEEMRSYALAALAMRKPLAHMQIVLMWGGRSDGPSTAEIVSFARALERAHGIGEQP